MTMERTQGWERRLSAMIERHRCTEFAWGVHDCALWAAAAVEAQTGVDLRPHLEGYTRAGEAWDMVRKKWGHIENAPEALGLREVPVPRARRGDIMTYGFRGGRWIAFGVCMGAQAALLGQRGLEWLPTLRARKAWRGW